MNKILSQCKIRNEKAVDVFLSLKNIHTYGDGNSKINLTIEAEYGFAGDTRTESLVLTYSASRRELHLTFNMDSPGIILVAESVANAFHDISAADIPRDSAPLFILTRLEEILSLAWDKNRFQAAMDTYLKE